MKLLKTEWTPKKEEYKKNWKPISNMRIQAFNSFSFNSICFYFQSGLIASHGYPVEEHEVHTVDGFILTLHRIPHGLKNASKGEILCFSLSSEEEQSHCIMWW